MPTVWSDINCAVKLAVPGWPTPMLSHGGPKSEMPAMQPLCAKPSEAPGVPVHEPTSETSNVTSIGSTTPPGAANEMTSPNDAVACVSEYGGKKLKYPELSPYAKTCSAPGVAVDSASHVISPVDSGLTVPAVDALADSTPVF